MPPQDQNYGNQMPPVEHKKSGSHTVLLALILIVLLVIAWLLWQKKPATNETLTPVDQTQTNQNQNGQDYQPNVPDTSTNKNKVYSISDLISQENLAHVSCNQTVPAVGKEFTVNGYIYYSDAAVLRNNSETRVIMRNSADITSNNLDLNLANNMQAKSAIVAKNMSNPNAWIHVQATGPLSSADLHAMGNACYKGFAIDANTVTILN